MQFLKYDQDNNGKLYICLFKTILQIGRKNYWKRLEISKLSLLTYFVEFLQNVILRYSMLN